VAESVPRTLPALPWSPLPCVFGNTPAKLMWLLEESVPLLILFNQYVFLSVLSH